MQPNFYSLELDEHYVKSLFILSSTVAMTLKNVCFWPTFYLVKQIRWIIIPLTSLCTLFGCLFDYYCSFFLSFYLLKFVSLLLPDFWWIKLFNKDLVSKIQCRTRDFIAAQGPTSQSKSAKSFLWLWSIYHHKLTVIHKNDNIATMNDLYKGKNVQ